MEQTVPDKKNAAGIYARAKALIAKKDFDGALAILDEILEKNEQDATALALAGDIYASNGDIQQAMGHYGLAIQADPKDSSHKRQFLAIAGKVASAQYNLALEQILCLCLETSDIECAHAQVLWYTILRSHPQFPPLLEAALAHPLNPFEKSADLSFLLQPIFLLGVKRIVVCNAEFEEFMTVLRRFLLLQSETAQKKLPAGQCRTLLEVVAQYCFNTDYIFNRTDAEEKAVENLRLELENNPAARQDVFKTGLYACYEPFYKMKAAKDMACLPLVKAQIEEYLDLQARAAKIPSLSEVTDVVSHRVREQYEEFPYPRWRELPPMNIDASLDKTGMQVLIAGCGTGHEPLPSAHAHPEINILAVDLSRTSLAYAARKAEEFGIKNVEFCHADILQLGSLNRKFDRISSAGVLHHIKEPVEGWKILTGLLKPGGFIRIGLYSAAARRSVVTAWEAIRKGNYPNTPAGMRRFRQDSKKLLGDALHDKIFGNGDYYHLNMYRDLLFHVQEHQFTLPQIRDILDELNLEFVKIDVPETVRQDYLRLFPTDPGSKDLNNWHKMEQANPDMFTGMYLFWCRKKA